MEISKEDILSGAVKAGISQHSAEALWHVLEENNVDKPTISSFTKLIYYFGALIVMGALAWFFMLGLESFGGAGIFLISCAYCLGFILAGRVLWNKKGLQVPAGLFFTLAVCMVPLAIYGLEIYTGLWASEGSSLVFSRISNNDNWLLMEIGTVIASLIALWFVPFPFLTAPLSMALWLISIDLAPMIYGKADLTLDDTLWIALWFGIGMIVISHLIDCRTKQDYSFWGYLFGLIPFWYGLTMLMDKGEVAWAFYCLINIILILLSLLIERRVFLIFGSLGVFLYFSHIAYEVFENSMWFPFALSFLGIAVIYLGILYQRHEVALHHYLQNILPENWKKSLLPQKRK